LYANPKHSAARKHRDPRPNRIIGLAVAASATLVTGVSPAPTAQASGSVWDAVAACESGGNWAVNTGNGFYGGLQFTRSTWNGFGGTAYAPTASRASKGAQIAIARRVLAAQGPGAWPTCSQRSGLTQANGGASGAAWSPSMGRSATFWSSAGSRSAGGRSAGGAVVGRPLVVDGVMGPATVAATQRWIGTAANGVFRARSVRALQRRVGIIMVGHIGPQTMRALQIHISARRDGARHMNAATVAALQRYLNRHSR
jgi:hypothetical protein